MDGIRLEREVVSALGGRTDLVIDTSQLNAAELKRLLTGHFAQETLLAFFSGLWRLPQPLLPRYEKEGKTYLTIGIGCTGGRHRSLYVAEPLAAELRAAGSRVELSHRDLAIPRSPAPIPAGAPVLAD